MTSLRPPVGKLETTIPIIWLLTKTQVLLWWIRRHTTRMRCKQLSLVGAKNSVCRANRYSRSTLKQSRKILVITTSALLRKRSNLSVLQDTCISLRSSKARTINGVCLSLVGKLEVGVGWTRSKLLTFRHISDQDKSGLMKKEKLQPFSQSGSNVLLCNAHAQTLPWSLSPTLFTYTEESVVQEMENKRTILFWRSKSSRGINLKPIFGNQSPLQLLQKLPRFRGLDLELSLMKLKLRSSEGQTEK